MYCNLKEIGRQCKALRASIGKTQSEVAVELGYSVENISAFETGRNSNLVIFMWYVTHGLDMDNIKRGSITYDMELLTRGYRHGNNSRTAGH